MILSWSAQRKTRISHKIIFVEAYSHVTIGYDGSKIVGALAIQAHQTAGVRY